MKNYFILILLCTLNTSMVFTQENKSNNMTYEPIGIFHTNYTPKTGAPRQGILIPEGKGTIEIFEPYHSALKDLNLFEYIIVLYHFSEVEKWESTVSPPASTKEHNFGLFATRSPKRPNPIGFSIIKLNKIENGVLHVSGIDAFEGTPVLDIKPYLPSIDCVKSVQNELIEKELGHHDENFIKDSTFFK